jgi:hypothetical protein
MSNFTIKTHREDAVYTGSQIFILNKGINSGKPQKQPFTNSFVIIAANDLEAEKLYWLAYSLWKCKFWHQFLIGSVIPFLRIKDFENGFKSKLSKAEESHVHHSKNLKSLQLLEQKETELKQNIKLITELKAAIFYQFYN